MRILGALVASSVFWLGGVAAAQTDDSTEHDRQIKRYLEVIRLPETLRGTFQAGAERGGADSQPLRDVIAMSDGEIIAAVTPTYRDLLTPEEARLIADFFTSDTAVALTRLQIAGEADPLSKLTTPQRDQYLKFAESPGGTASARIFNLTRDQAFWDLLGMKLMTAARASRPAAPATDTKTAQE
jgi:hypothetical protein